MKNTLSATTMMAQRKRKVGGEIEHVVVEVRTSLGRVNNTEAQKKALLLGMSLKALLLETSLGTSAAVHHCLWQTTRPEDVVLLQETATTPFG